MVDAEINGLILWHGAAQAVRLERSLLMLDAKSWAKWIVAKKREEAAQVARDGGIRPLAEINQQIREIDRWLVTGQGLCRGIYVLHRRVLFGTPVVTAETLSLYIRKLLRFQAEIEADQSPEFLFNADSEPPMLFVTDNMSAAARHSGQYVRGKVVERREMMRLIRNGLRAILGTSQLLLEDGEVGSSEA